MCAPRKGDNLDAKQHEPQKEATATHPGRRDWLLVRLQAAVSDEQDSRWLQGDIILQLMALAGPMPAYRAAANITGKSLRWSIELAKVAKTFPAPMRGKADWSVYRVAANCPSPQTCLELAVREQLTASHLVSRLATLGIAQ